MTAHKHSPEHSRWLVSTILLAIALVASTILIGGVHGATAALVALVCIIGLGWSLEKGASTGGETEGMALSIPALFFAWMGLLCLVQLLPVPRFIYALLQPSGEAHLLATWAAVYPGEEPLGWHLLSLDPRATSEQALKWFALSAGVALAARLGAGRWGRRGWMGVILGVGALVALAGMVQALSNTTKILGVYQAEISARSLSPFVSTNHAASFYGLIALVGVAYGLDHLKRSPWKAVCGAVAATAGVILCAAHGSDGALGALAVAMAILGISALVKSRPKGKTSRRWLAGAVPIALGALVTATLFIPDHWTVAEEEDFLGSTSAEARISMGQAALAAVPDYARVGSGAASVDRAMAQYVDWRRFGSTAVPTIENEPLEWALTMGPLAALLAVALFAYLLARTAPHIVQRRGRRGASYAFAILVYMGIIALFHFPFQTLGISLVAMVALEVSLDQRRDGLHYFASLKASRLFVAALTLSVLGLLGARATLLSPGPEQTLEVSDQEAVSRALHLYPTDGMLLSALSLEARDDERFDDALRLSQRAFEVRPHPTQEYLLARSLALVGQKQEAALRYQSLLDKERRSVGLWGQVLARLRHDLPEPAHQALALANSAEHYWQRHANHLRKQVSATAAIEFALAMVELRPNQAASHLLLIETYIRAKQTELAEIYARSLISQGLVESDGEQPAGLIALLHILGQQDRQSEALGLVDRAFASGHDSSRLAQAALALRPADPRTVQERDRRILAAAEQRGCQPPYDDRRQRRRCWEARAYLAEIEGDLERAQALLRRVDRQDGDPRPLGALLARQGLCQELAGLIRTHRGDRHQQTLKRRAQECARGELESGPAAP